MNDQIKYEEFLKLKNTIDEMREKLDELLAITGNPLRGDILELSTKLDSIIYKYYCMERMIKKDNP